VAKALNELLEPIRKSYEESPEWQEVTLKAYPPPAKKQKKVKDKGSRYPGGGKPAESSEQAQTLPDRTA
jgi:tyrosyl-tRNA synthetase